MPLWIKRKQFPAAVTVVTPILKDRVPELRALLHDTTVTIRNKTDSIFCKLEAVHYARWFIADEDGPYPVCLVYSCVTDLEPKEHFANLMSLGGTLLRQVYAMCDVPFDANTSDDTIVSYLSRRNISSAAGFKGLRSHTVAQISQENDLYQSIQGYLSSQVWSGRSPADVRRDIQRYVVITPGLEWASKPEARSILTDFLRVHFGLFVAFLLVFGMALGAVPFIAAFFLVNLINDLGRDSVPFFIFWWFGVVPWLPWLVIGRIAILRLEESFESGGYYASEKEGYFEKVAAIEDEEDWSPQNPMSLVVTVKTSPLRIGNLKVVMAAVKFACKYLLFHGNLGGIVSIHFADWVFINNERRILFLSNYDGSWEAYLAEFLEGRALLGFNAIYSNTRGYPRTTFLVGRGAKRQARMFKELVRERQTVTDFWYAHYDYLSVANLLINSAVRRGLWGQMSDEDCAKWLQKF